MATEYISEFTGKEIDNRLKKVGTLNNYDDTELKQQLTDLSTAVSSKASSGELNEHISDTDMHTTAVEKDSWNNASQRSLLNFSTLGYQRKNLLKNTETDRTFRGVTFTMNADGSITMNGTAEGLAHLYLCSFNFKAGVKYRLSGGVNSETRLSLIDSNGGEVPRSMDSGNGAEFSFDEDTTMRVRLRAGNTGEVLDNVTVYPMLRYADISDDSYEPYKPSVEERLALTPQTFLLYDGANTNTAELSENSDNFDMFIVETAAHGVYLASGKYTWHTFTDCPPPAPKTTFDVGGFRLEFEGTTCKLICSKYVLSGNAAKVSGSETSENTVQIKRIRGIKW